MRPTGLRARVLLIVGVGTTLFMMLLSWGLLYSWRSNLVDHELSAALAVSRAFSVAVIDALIAEDQDLYQAEGFLDNYVTMFMAQNTRLTAITILDHNGRVAARSWERDGPPWITDDPLGTLARGATSQAIRPDAEGRWVLETVFPLATGARRWGGLVIGVEADSIRGQIRRSFFLLALFTWSVTSVLLVILWLLLSRVLGSLETLVQAMDAMDLSGAAGPDLPTRQDEIGSLYQHFRTMQRRIDQSRDDLIAAQRQVWHAERLAAIGRLASGLAHEINNPINGVRSCIAAIRTDPGDSERTRSYLAMMDEGLSNAAGVVGKLLGFARKQQSGTGPVDLDEAAAAVARLVAFDLKRRDRRLDVAPSTDLPPVLGDRQLLQEVVMNLVLNAADATTPGGNISVRTEHADDRVVLVVADDGPGVAPADRDRIFDPFFTTKEPGRGTGLGLSICLGIVQAAGGTLVCTDAPGGGAVFTVSLPAAPSPREELP